MRALLTAKDRQLHPQAQVAKLLRIARRAESKADWLEELGASSPQFASDREAIAEQRDRASAACDEVIRIVQDHPDAGWTLAQRRYCASQEVER